MPVERSSRRFLPARIVSIARGLLNRSKLFALATVSPGGRAHINAAYFAWDRAFAIVWLSAPEARHSRNVRANPSAAIVVYDPTQKWGGPDRGIQLFGSARELRGSGAREAARLYHRRFPDYDDSELSSYRFYRFRPKSMKLFHERALGGGVFVTARVDAAGQTTWVRTENYR